MDALWASLEVPPLYSVHSGSSLPVSPPSAWRLTGTRPSRWRWVLNALTTGRKGILPVSLGWLCAGLQEPLGLEVRQSPHR